MTNVLHIELPWPPASLSGHNNGHWRSKNGIVAKHRTWAKLATIAADPAPMSDKGDIGITFTFYPPDRRSDRLNYVIRVKPYADGIAEALGVNDRRFLPRFSFAEPVSNPRVVIELLP